MASAGARARAKVLYEGEGARGGRPQSRPTTSPAMAFNLQPGYAGYLGGIGCAGYNPIMMYVMIIFVPRVQVVVCIVRGKPILC